MQTITTEELIEETQVRLYFLDVSAFLHQGRAYFKNWAAKEEVGQLYLKLQDALDNRWILQNELGANEEFAGIEELLDAGWILD